MPRAGAPAPAVVLHIGAPKTGTSSIQRLLASNQQVLADHGVVYPRAGRPRGALRRMVDGHHDLAYAMVRGDADPWFQLRRELDGTTAHTAVLSSETFAWLGPARRVDAVRHFFAGHAVRVVLYLRHQVSQARSLYLQELKAGLCSGSYRAFLEANLERLRYEELLGPWIEQFGTAAVHVHSYDAACAPPGLLAHFTEHLEGVPWDDLRRPADQNQTPGPAALAAARRLTAWHRGLARPGWPIYDRGLDLVVRAVRGVAARDGTAARVVSSGAPVVDSTPAADDVWLRAHVDLARWNDAFRARWPHLANLGVFADQP